MASYHLSVKTGGKGSASPHADYISRDGKYAREKDSDLEHKESGNMPAWAAHKPSEFWKAADTSERANGCTYREIEIALPRELKPEQRLELVRDFVQQEIGDRHAYQFAIHNPKAAIAGGEQPHAHIMFSERINDGIHRDPEQYFKRANTKEPERGGAKKARFGETPTERKEYLVAQRERWADLQNKHLERYQHADRVDSRSLKAQGIDREPERHLGAGQVQRFDTEQLQSILARREAERQAQQSRDERDCVIDVTTSLEMEAAVQNSASQQHIFIGCAAVADYRAVTIAEEKIKKQGDELTIKMIKNPDIVAGVAALKAHRPYVVGFAAETNNVEEYARQKRIRKNLDVICANDVSLSTQGFNSDSNALHLFWQDGDKVLPLERKELLGQLLLDEIVTRYDEKNRR